MQKKAGIFMIVGAVVFTAGIFQPGIMAYFDAPNEAQARAALEANALSWDIGNLLFGLGGLFATIGVSLLARHIRSHNDNATARMASAVSEGLVVAGMVLWGIITYTRIAASVEQTMTGTMFGEPWIFPLYSILTLIGLAVMGVALLKAEYHKLLGWYVILFHLGQFIMGLVTWDAVPLFWYFPMLVIGIVLLFAKPRMDKESNMVTEMA